MSIPASELVGALPPGTRMHEYVLERVLGHGGFGITYLARDTHLDKAVAIKEYLPNDLAARLPDTSVSARSTDLEVLEAFKWGLNQFVKEARVLARFSHPSLIQVHRYFEANGTAYFVMEYAEGVTLAQVLKDKNTIPETHLRKIIFPVLDGLEEVHRLGVLHRDIKPDNIILRQDGAQPVLIDFGAARNSLGHMTKSVMSVVTAGYAPLEQYGTDVAQGPWSDLYAMGAVAYRAVAGKKPSDAVNRIRQDPVVEASIIGKGRYTPHFLAAIDWALAVNPEDRPQNIADWRKALDGKLTPPARNAPAPAKSVSAPVSTVEKTEIVKKSEIPGAPTDISATVAMPKAARKARKDFQAVPDALIQQARQNLAGFSQKQLAIAGGVAAGLVVLGILAVLLSGGEPEPAPPIATANAPVNEAPQPAAPVAAPAPAPAPGAKAKPEVAVPKREQAVAESAPQKKPPVQTAKAAPAKPRQIAVGQMAPLSSFQDCPRCPAMVALTAGSYSMGSPPGAAAAAAWEGPAHTISFVRPFGIGKFEVTAAEWQACVQAQACAPAPAAAGTGDADKLPAVNVNWSDAQTYLNWLSKTSGRRYRLPTEAEWEYAIRAGTTTARFWGESRTGQCDYANGADLSAIKLDSNLRAGDQPCDDRHATLAAAGRFKPNAYGLHDLAGNVWEWTQDCWVDSYKAAPADGGAVDLPNCSKRVIRGGSWRTKPESLRSANRGLSPATFRGDDLGFRVVAE
jgi:formylglycine-generating enzyme required for sulfatase activity/serine/threonine protein kinase